MTCFLFVQDRFFLGFPDFVKDALADCFNDAEVGIAVVAGIFDDVTECFEGTDEDDRWFW